MAGFTISEKTKDRILDVLVVGSLLLLVFGPSRPDAPQVAQPQEDGDMVAARMYPIEAKPLPMYETIAELPLNSKPEQAAVVESKPRATKNTAVAQNVPESSQPGQSSSGSIRGTLSSINTTINNTLNSTRLNIF